MFVMYVVLACLIGVFVVFSHSHFWAKAEGYLYTRAHEVKTHPPEAARPASGDHRAAPPG